MNEKKLDYLIEQYVNFFKNIQWNFWIEERNKRKIFYQEYNSSKIMNLSYDEMIDYLKKMWNVLPISTNKILDKNGFENFKNNLIELLYGKDNIEKRYNNFHESILEFKVSGISEILSYNYPNEFMIWNGKVKKLFEYLEIPDVPLESDNVDYKLYKKMNDYGKIIQSKLSEKLKNNIDLLDTDYFYELTSSCSLINTNELTDAVSNYKNTFIQNIDKEKFKWEAIKTFQDNWNINDKNFIQMFNKSFEKTELLLNNNRSYLPLKMINIFADHDVERVRNMFKYLFNEDIDLNERYLFFTSEADSILKEINSNVNSNQDIHAISVYLSFMFPSKYYIYKDSIVKNVNKLFECNIYEKANYLSRDKTPMDTYCRYCYFCNNILEFILKDKELLKLSKDHYEKYYNDSTKHMLLWDIIYYIGKSKNEEVEPNDNKINYWIISANPENIDCWDEFKENEYIRIGWNRLGNLLKYKSKSAINTVLNKYYPSKNKYSNNHRKNDIQCIYQFANDIKINDVVIVKNGKYSLYGYGIIQSKYLRKEDKNICEVKWKKTGNFDATSIIEKNNFPVKTLTKITENIGKKLIDLMEDENMNNEEKINWIISGNEDKIYNLSKCFEDNGFVEWIQDDKFNIGDIVYIYCSGKQQKIKYKTVVEKNNILFSDKENKNNYYIDGTTDDRKSLYMKLKLLVSLDTDELNLTKLRENGLLSNLQSHENINKKNNLLAYVEKIFDKYSKKYTWEDIDDKVFLDKDQYKDICRLLDNNKNLIIQGPPGVGKTYITKKIIYTLIERIDDSQIKYVQFHQNYSYEDFVRGYRPTSDGGFKLKDGIFLNFCNEARNHSNKKYYLIIDEINRGNLSKIFGELLTLIEKDKREDYDATLAYQLDSNKENIKIEEKFTIPKNLYIIGLMNTADRSIDSMDYAFRRRFAFYTILPLFKNKKFEDYVDKTKNKKFKNLITEINKLNDQITEDSMLGEEFTIGHSYFSNLENISDQMLLDIIDYEIKPLLKEYWYDDKEKVEEITKQLRGVINDKNK